MTEEYTPEGARGAREKYVMCSLGRRFREYGRDKAQKNTVWRDRQTGEQDKRSSADWPADSVKEHFGNSKRRYARFVGELMV